MHTLADAWKGAIWSWEYLKSLHDYLQVSKHIFVMHPFPFQKATQIEMNFVFLVAIIGPDLLLILDGSEIPRPTTVWMYQTLRWISSINSINHQQSLIRPQYN